MSKGDLEAARAVLSSSGSLPVPSVLPIAQRGRGKVCPSRYDGAFKEERSESWKSKTRPSETSLSNHE